MIETRDFPLTSSIGSWIFSKFDELVFARGRPVPRAPIVAKPQPRLQVEIVNAIYR